jgi:hypothetical protein
LISLKRLSPIVVPSLCLAVALSRWLGRAQSPDAFDSFNFLLGMSRKFDLAKFQPQFPGYPVYVGLGAVLCRLGIPALAAATGISSAASALSAWSLGICARRLGGPAAGVAAIVLHLVAWLPWLIGSGAWSDSLGTAFAVSAFATLAFDRPRPGAAGVLGGLLLGTRASYWPIVGSLLFLASHRELVDTKRWRVFVGLGLGVIVWAIPFFAVVGIHDFFTMGVEHLRGHFTWWGGSVATRPDLLLRSRAFGRDLLFDGFAPSLWAVVAIAIVVAGSAALARMRHVVFASRFPFVPILVAVVPYAIWAFAAQNVIDQPRHVLPLVEAGLLALACWLARQPIAIGSVAAIALVVNVPLIRERHQTPPAPAQAAAWVAEHEVPSQTAIMTDRSWRFFMELPGPFKVRQHTWLSEVIVDLARFDRLPTSIVLTSEIDLHSGMGEQGRLPRSWRIDPGPRFCRDARIDRELPCLGLSHLVYAPR